MKKRPLWLYRPLINQRDVLRWAIESGIPKMIQPDHLHLTIATARGRVDWNLLGALHDDTITIPAGDKPLVGLGTHAWCLSFDDQRLQTRFAEITSLMAIDFGDDFNPHLTLLRGQEPSPMFVYSGELVFGPEVAKPFLQGMTMPRGIPINRNVYREMAGLPLRDDQTQIEIEFHSNKAKRREEDKSRPRDEKYKMRLQDY